MSNNIIVINGPNLNLLGKREQSQYGAITFEQLKENCQAKAKELNVNLEFYQSNIEGEIVTRIQKSKNEPPYNDFMFHTSHWMFYSLLS